MNNKILYVAIALLVTTSATLGYLYWQEKNNVSQVVQPVSSEDQTQANVENEEEFQQHTASDVVAVIKGAGLSIRDVQGQEIGGGAAPATEVESKEFVIEQVAPNGGQILVFADQSGLDSKKTYFDNFPDLAPYVYVQDNIILQLNSGLPSVDALKYQEALNAL